jgi:hypothetical protein
VRGQVGEEVQVTDVERIREWPQDDVYGLCAFVRERWQALGLANWNAPDDVKAAGRALVEEQMAWMRRGLA